MNDFDRLFALSGLSLDRLRSFLRVAEAGNLAKAAKGDVTQQSQFSRQIKELESYFGVELTRRVGRRIEITGEGRHLALMIRRQFRELDDFRESMAGRNVSVHIGTQGSVIHWLLLPRLAQIRSLLGSALIEMEQMRSNDVVRAVADGRLDFGIVRDDALPKEIKRHTIGKLGYSVFAAKALWQGRPTVEKLLQSVPVAELLPDGQFSERWRDYLTTVKPAPQRYARASTFNDLARIVRAGEAAAVLPDLAAVDFDPKLFLHQPLPAFPPRPLVLIANARSIERVGMPAAIVAKLAGLLAIG
jgi:DNA-binding transcriptional LysR family regulator